MSRRKLEFFTVIDHRTILIIHCKNPEGTQLQTKFANSCRAELVRKVFPYNFQKPDQLIEAGMAGLAKVGFYLLRKNTDRTITHLMVDIADVYNQPGCFIRLALQLDAKFEKYSQSNTTRLGGKGIKSRFIDRQKRIYRKSNVTAQFMHISVARCS